MRVQSNSKEYEATQWRGKSTMLATATDKFIVRAEDWLLCNQDGELEGVVSPNRLASDFREVRDNQSFAINCTEIEKALFSHKIK